ncbi:MAG: NAD(P)H-quinone oxidoreductase [Acidimicrobiales bacterium]
MRAVVISTPGGPEVLTVVEVPDPVPGPDEILVEVVATAVNRADILQRLGRYPAPAGAAADVPGLEFSGRVRAVGGRVTRWSPGDAVMGLVGGGAYAELLTLHEREAIAVPEGMAVADAGAVPEVFTTAYDALFLQGGLRGGGRALVHAGASGVGTAAIQIVKALGARVAVTCSAGKVAACEALGADLVVDYTSADFGVEVAAWTGPDGVDVVLDVVGGEYLDRNLDVLTTGGTIVQVGILGSPDAMLPLPKLLARRARLIGTVLRSRPLEEKIAVARRVEADLLPLFDAGLLHPVIDRRVPFAEVADAHRAVESNEVIGKVAIDVAS